MIRLFAALDLPFEITEGLTRRQSGLAGAQWRPVETLHVTLRFFGEVSEMLAEDLDGALAAVRHPPIELYLQGAGAFGELDQRTAVWAGVAPNPALDRLASKCESVAQRLGLPADRRPYRPHVTLAYLKHKPGPPVAAWIAENNLLRSPAWTARRFGLYSSALGRGGARYRLEREYLLV